MVPSMAGSQIEKSSSAAEPQGADPKKHGHIARSLKPPCQGLAICFPAFSGALPSSSPEDGMTRAHDAIPLKSPWRPGTTHRDPQRLAMGGRFHLIGRRLAGPLFHLQCGPGVYTG